MPRWAKIVLILSLVLAGLAGSGALIFTKLSGARAELDAIVEPMIREMADHRWDRATMLKYASPRLTEHVEEKGFGFDPYPLAALGPVTEYVGVQEFKKSSQKATVMTIVNFTAGTARIHIIMSRHGDAWLVDNFNIQYSKNAHPGSEMRSA